MDLLYASSGFAESFISPMQLANLRFFMEVVKIDPKVHQSESSEYVIDALREYEALLNKLSEK